MSKPHGIISMVIGDIDMGNMKMDNPTS
jgi:hypothetical protein